MKQTNTLQEQADKKVIQFFSSLADETRLKVILSLAEGPKSVNEIYDYVGREKVSLSAISHQLKILSDIDMVKHKRNGQEKIFELSNDFCWCIVKDVFKHFNGNSQKFNECCGCSTSVKKTGGKN